MHRRQFIKNVGATIPWAMAFSANSIAVRAFAQSPARVFPELTEANILRFTAGLRPFRKSGPRIEREKRFGKILVHNYGHSGAGITLSWGSAMAAVDLIPDVRKNAPIAILGGGVIGLSVAHELRERDFTHVTIYASQWHPHVTSSIAGGQWSPALVGEIADPALKARYDLIVENSFKKYAQFKGLKYGVSLRDNILMEGSHDPLLSLNFPELPQHHSLEQPFVGLEVAANIYRSWLIEPPLYLPALMHRLHLMGVVFKTQSFAATDNEGNNSSDVENLKENMVFNCLGLGSKKIIVDDDLLPIRGRLIHLKPEPRIDYLLLQKDGYMFSRRDALVLGGTYDEGASDLSLDLAQYEGIMKVHRDFFRITDQPGKFMRTAIPYQPVTD